MQHPLDSSSKPFPTRSAQRRILIPTIAITLLALAILGRFGLPVSSGDVRALFPLTSPTLSALQRMESLFGESLFDSILIDIPEHIADEVQTRVGDLRDEIGDVPGVVSVISPVEGLSRLGIPVRTLTPDRRTGRLLVEINSSLNDTERAKLNEEISTIMGRYTELRPIRAGAFSVSEDATAALQRESAIWTPVCVVVLILVTLALLRDLLTTIAVLAAPFISLLILFAGLQVLRIPLLPIAQLVPPLLLGLGASYSMFIACRYLDANASRDIRRTRGVVGSTILACVTTIAGFASLIPLDTRAVAQFGILMTIGTAISGLLSILITPRILPQAQRRVERAARSLQRLSRNAPLKVSILVPTVILSSALSVGMSKLEINTSPLDFLPKGSETIKAVEETLARFPGSHQLFLSLERPTPFGDNDRATIDQLSGSIRSIPGVQEVTSLSDFARLDDRIHQKGSFAEGGSLSDMRFGPSSYTTENREATRLFIETDAEGRALMKIRDQITQRVSQTSLPAVSFSVASRELIMAEQSDALARGLLLSVGSALLLVAILLLVVFRSIPVMFVGLLPSILPIIAVFGGLGFVSGQVNMGTAMVAAVALGMISDNTFHFLVAWRFRDPEVSQTPLQLSSGPMIATALVLVGGFCPTILSSLPPMNQFGLLLSICVSLGLCGNLFLLPQLVSRHLQKSHRAVIRG